MNTKCLVVVAVLAVMLIGSAGVVTEDAFASKKKHYEKSQAVSQANDCGNGGWAVNVGCQNTASQIQGDDNSAAQESSQTFTEAAHDQ
ncbi:MAG TPA: hypothetical protein VFG77_00520 [Nitrososphaeraceae archaeon]|nr:hypothetical protein [Nitrososphaeraceae archaeon]